MIFKVYAPTPELSCKPNDHVQPPPIWGPHFLSLRWRSGNASNTSVSLGYEIISYVTSLFSPLPPLPRPTFCAHFSDTRSEHIFIPILTQSVFPRKAKPPRPHGPSLRRGSRWRTCVPLATTDPSPGPLRWYHVCRSSCAEQLVPFPSPLIQCCPRERERGEAMRGRVLVAILDLCSGGSRKRLEHPQPGCRWGIRSHS